MMASARPWGGRLALFWLISFAFLLPDLALGSNCPSQKTKGNYTNTFVGVSHNTDGTSTWSYTLEWNGAEPPPEHFIV